MANLFVYIDSILKPYYKYMMMFFLFVLFVTVARFAYQTSFVKVDKNKKAANIANANNVKPITSVYFFHVDWCPHCVKAIPEWNAFVEIYNGKEINGHLVQCYDIDCTDDNGDVTVQIDPTTGSTSLNYFGGSYSNTSTMFKTIGGVGTSGKLLNLNHQTQYVFRVITRDLDSSSRIRPDNL
jgi:thiol-disulfide isomerase/thioredoxin